MPGLELKIVLIHHHTYSVITVHLASILLFNSNYTQLTSTPARIECSVLQ